MLDTRVIYCGDDWAKRLEPLAKPALSLSNGLPDRCIDLIYRSILYRFIRVIGRHRSDQHRQRDDGSSSFLFARRSAMAGAAIRSAFCRITAPPSEEKG
ncbi:MAG TPA: hypothetical protein VGR35_23080 [Tepidisphaeraceae bacterium]|nr:hypothetical protein [Tepidisphaeraceae bacterium]